MPSFKTLFFPDEIAQMPAYLRIRGGIVNRSVGPVPDITGKVFNTQKASFKVETSGDGPGPALGHGLPARWPH